MLSITSPARSKTPIGGQRPVSDDRGYANEVAKLGCLKAHDCFRPTIQSLLVVFMLRVAIRSSLYLGRGSTNNAKIEQCGNFCTFRVLSSCFDHPQIHQTRLHAVLQPTLKLEREAFVRNGAAKASTRMHFGPPPTQLPVHYNNKRKFRPQLCK